MRDQTVCVIAACMSALLLSKIPITANLKFTEKPWKELFLKYLNSHSGVLRKPEQTTKLIWDTQI